MRVLRRLEELVRQASAGAKIMGDAELTALFADVTTRIKRDVVFAPSLYL